MTDITVTETYYSPGIFVVRLVNILVGIVEALFALRIVLELFAANPGSQFVAWVYNVTAYMIGPFAGAFPSIPLGNGAVFDVVALLAMIAYAVLGWVLIQILSFIFSSTV